MPSILSQIVFQSNCRQLDCIETSSSTPTKVLFKANLMLSTDFLPQIQVEECELVFEFRKQLEAIGSFPIFSWKLIFETEANLS